MSRLVVAVIVSLGSGCSRSPPAAAPMEVDGAAAADDEHRSPTGPSTVIRGIIRRDKEREARQRQERLRELERSLHKEGNFP